MCEVYKLHVIDAIELFDNAWNKASTETVLKCWIKSIFTTLQLHCCRIIGDVLEISATSIEMDADH